MRDFTTMVTDTRNLHTLANILRYRSESRRQVGRARDNLRYIGERVTRGMDEIEQDVGKELRVTGRLTTQSAKLAGVLRRFGSLEENVIEVGTISRHRSKEIRD
ncbi:unnamed protein product [Heterotrigona itama]|uniref:Uncharacterized protein n=1 Tax=Heterotrigona itama TaxID=395501 RepID=A0A6V7HCR9_9HYME|nr:unnamed protein product [Heterotrigona itama]